MAASSQNGNGMITGINVTPLVDVTLVLLIIFIVTAKIIVAPALPLDLPKAATSEEVQVVFSVIIAQNGATLVNGAPANSDETLLDLAKQAAVRDPDLRAVINADGAVPHRKVMRALDLLKSAGITRVAFGAVPEEDKR
jgi:biopolymer transport protein ExbD